MQIFANDFSFKNFQLFTDPFLNEQNSKSYNVY